MSEDLSKERLLGLYYEMVKIRVCEERFAQAYAGGLIHGACHTYVGEEAIAVGVCAHLDTKDAVFSTHRGHGHALAKGVPPSQVAAELFGRVTGCSQGRGGSMHLFSPEVGMMGTSGIVGPCILQATGAGYSFQLLGQDHVGVAFFGDGAVNNGAFHEGVNLATIWNLPVLFICENNQFATEVPFAYASGNPDVGNRGEAYGLPGEIVDGNDVLAVFEAAGRARQRAARGEGPTLIECKTYRTRAHAEGMRDGGYRSEADVEAWKEKDPIGNFRKKILAEDRAVETDFDAVDAEVETLIDEAFEFAEKSPWPDPATAADFIFSTRATTSEQP
jgi:2-oxoisovalerate dehydrogenase E1 component